MSRSMPSAADAARLAWTLLARWWRASAQTARLAIGIPDYDNYLEHMRRSHPGRSAMTREEFFHERMAARYGKGRSRCC
nr:CstA-like transporter-associated (seleno)protein [Lysobacter niastensis]